MNEPVLGPEKDCTGCEACRNRCPETAITMQSDNGGFLQPVVDSELCTGCQQCVKACPVLQRPALERTSSPTVYACWHHNEEVRMKSSSGGAFSALAESVLDKGGVVFGAAYDETLHVHHTGIEHIKDLDMLRRSKYVQSEIGTTFIQARQHLEKNRPVLFVGTPCQIAGLYGYLGRNYENLLAIDFICHGVPSPRVFAKYISWLQNCYSAKLKTFDFRGKRKGWQNIISSAYLNDGRQVVLKGTKNCFYHGFIAGTFLREACFACTHMTFPRLADLTIGDFWGIGEKVHFGSELEKPKGISLVMANSVKGKGALKSLSNSMTLEERTLEEAVAGNIHLQKPAKKPENRCSFFAELNDLDFKALAIRYLSLSGKARVQQFVKENLGTAFIDQLRTLKKAL